MSQVDIEKNIITGMVTSDLFISTLIPLIDTKLFTLDINKLISSWIVEYHEAYKKAPRHEIVAIFNAKKGTIKSEESEQISDFLQLLSDQYIDHPPNENYLITQATDYLKKKKLQSLIQEASLTLDNGGGVTDAENVLNKYKTFQQVNPLWKDPFNINYIIEMFNTIKDPLITIDGEFGKLIGNLERGFLVGVLAAMKVGKSTLLIDLAVKSVLQYRKVVFISLEMSNTQISQRFLQNVGCFGIANSPEKEYLFPTVDCRKNQDNTCTDNKRTCKVEMPVEEYQTGQKYKPCSVCKPGKNFVPRNYKVKEVKPGLSQNLATKLIKDLEYQFGSNFLRIISYPPFSANLSKIQNDLTSMEIEGFIPDVIVLDYADILAPEDSKMEAIHQVDRTWKALKAMAQEKNCLVLTATQGGRKTFDKEVMSESDTSWDIRKLAHVDLMIGMIRTDTDKKEGIAKINVIAHRWKDFNKNIVYKVCQQLEVAQPNLDGFLTTILPTKKKAVPKEGKA